MAELTYAGLEVINAALLPFRFWPKVLTGPGCWEWQGAMFGNGYGNIGVGLVLPDGTHEFRNIPTHRIAYLLTHGELPAAVRVRHTCDNRRCCRPEHLLAGTQKDNIQDCIKRGRFRPGAGERHRRRTLTWDQVREIRELHAQGATQSGLARSLKVSLACIHNVVRHKTWRA